MKNSLRQLLRTPGKAGLFFSILLLSTMLLVLGTALMTVTQQRMDQVEEEFTTIATVSQREDSVRYSQLWDSAVDQYLNYSSPVYTGVLSPDILYISGVEYLVGPEKRPYYGAWVNQYETAATESYWSFSTQYLIATFTPLEDCIPSDPVRVRIVDVLLGDPERYSATEFWFCDHYTKDPMPLEAGKTYIACMSMCASTHTLQAGGEIEFIPMVYPSSTQYDREGNKLECELNDAGQRVEEVNEAFLVGGRLKVWKNLARSYERLVETIPVLPTESCSLLPSFHEGDVTFTAGRNISDEEFSLGETVCIITQEFALRNDLSVGDSLTLPLYFADYANSPAKGFGYNGGAIDFSLLNAEGEIYPVFLTETFEIVGIYRYNGSNSGQLGNTEMAQDMVVIPQSAIPDGADVDNILAYGPMLDTTTSFQIENGTIPLFEELFSALPESDYLEISYDDNGYEQIRGNLESTRKAAVLLFAAGAVSTFLVIALLLYTFVVRQRVRTAIERGLGMTKGQCKLSVICGLAAISLGATILGSLLAVASLSGVYDLIGADYSQYSTKYSSWAVEGIDAVWSIETAVSDNGTVLLYSCLIPLAVTGTIVMISSLLMEKNMSKSPMEYLGGRME